MILASEFFCRELIFKILVANSDVSYCYQMTGTATIFKPIEWDFTCKSLYIRYLYRLAKHS